MSFNGYKSIIQKGDTVILYLTISQVYSIKAEAKALSKKGVTIDSVFQTPYGALRCGDLIGCKYGSKVNLSRGWAYVLQPTPELWTLTLPHRTQIIYTPDVSMIVLQLQITPGSVVVESGTGSGSLSHALIRAVKPLGHLYTFDFHEQRANTAKEEFESHGLKEWVTVAQRDVCVNGFGNNLDNKADAVFLDLPHPWLAIPHALKSLKATGGRLCSFSPCIEQVQKSCMTLAKLNFHEILTLEVIQTQHSVQQQIVQVMNLDFVKSKKTEDQNAKPGKEVLKTLCTQPPVSQPGHTGFLTFATLPPIWAINISNDFIEDCNDCE